MELNYYIAKKDETVGGPYSSSEIFRMLERGEIDGNTRIWFIGVKQWIPLCRVLVKILERHRSVELDIKRSLLVPEGKSEISATISLQKTKRRAEEADSVGNELEEEQLNIGLPTNIPSLTGVEDPLEKSKINKYARSGVIWLVLLFIVPCCCLPLCSEDEALKIVVLTLFLINLGVLIYLLTRLYKAWKCLQPLKCYSSITQTVPTPLEAVGFLCIPLFNLYWIFIAFPGALKGAQRLSGKLRLGVSFNYWPAVLYCILCIICFFSSKAIPESKLFLWTCVISYVSFLVWFLVEVKKVIYVFSNEPLEKSANARIKALRK